MGRSFRVFAAGGDAYYNLLYPLNANMSILHVITGIAGMIWELFRSGEGGKGKNNRRTQT